MNHKNMNGSIPFHNHFLNPFISSSSPITLSDTCPAMYSSTNPINAAIASFFIPIHPSVSVVDSIDASIANTKCIVVTFGVLSIVIFFPLYFLSFIYFCFIWYLNYLCLLLNIFFIIIWCTYWFYVLLFFILFIFKLIYHLFKVGFIFFIY